MYQPKATRLLDWEWPKTAWATSTATGLPTTYGVRVSTDIESLRICRSVVNFHAADGSGYKLLADMTLKVDAVNPQVTLKVHQVASKNIIHVSRTPREPPVAASFIIIRMFCCSLLMPTRRRLLCGAWENLRRGRRTIPRDRL